MIFACSLEFRNMGPDSCSSVTLTVIIFSSLRILASKMFDLGPDVGPYVWLCIYVSSSASIRTNYVLRSKMYELL